MTKLRRLLLLLLGSVFLALTVCSAIDDLPWWVTGSLSSLGLLGSLMAIAPWGDEP